MDFSEPVERIKGVRTLLFDLDNTLYPREKGVFERVNERIDRYVADRTGRTGGGVRTLRREYIDRYGTTLGGLMHHHRVDPDEYLDFVHAVPVEEMLETDGELHLFLEAVGVPKLIFTNASAAHARRVLDALGVASSFDGIVDLADTGYKGKPAREAFVTALRRSGSQPGKALFVDDMAVNVDAARGMGLLTAHVGSGGNGVGHFSVERVVDLREKFRGVPWFRG